eukprot:2783668-Pyramimonas_sp.AAC.1
MPMMLQRSFRRKEFILQLERSLSREYDRVALLPSNMVADEANKVFVQSLREAGEEQCARAP